MAWRRSKQYQQPAPPDSVAWVRVLRTPQELQEAQQRAAAYQARARAMLEGKRMNTREALQALQAQDQSASPQSTARTQRTAQAQDGQAVDLARAALSDADGLAHLG